MVTRIEFNLEYFSVSLGWYPPKAQWEDIALDVLTDAEQSAVAAFLSLASQGSGDVDFSNILLAKADEKMANIKQVYGPCIMQDPEHDDRLILAMGSNLFPVTVQLGTKPHDPYLHVGDLHGVFEKETRNDREYISAVFSGPTDDPEWVVSCRMADQSPSLNILLKILESPRALASHFLPKGAGGGYESIGVSLSKDFPCIPMKALPKDYALPVMGIMKKPGNPEANDYRADNSYLLNIGNSFTVWLNGNTIGGRSVDGRWPNIPMPCYMITSPAGDKGQYVSARFSPRLPANLPSDATKALAIATGQQPPEPPTVDTHAVAIESRAALSPADDARASLFTDTAPIVTGRPPAPLTPEEEAMLPF